MTSRTCTRMPYEVHDALKGESGDVMFAIAYHLNGNVTVYHHPSTTMVHDPETSWPPPQGKLEKSELIQILTINLSNPQCKVIIFPDGTKVHFHIP